MDCIQAQSLISEALDRSPVDADALETAKAHCRECAQCRQYVRALTAIRRAAVPDPPDGLADRIMEAVRAEAAGAHPSALIADAPDVEPEPQCPDVTPTGQTDAFPHPPTTQWVSFAQGRMNRRQLIAWGSAAAVLLVVVGVSATLGIMRLVNGSGSPSATSDSVQTAAVESAPKAADSAATGSVAGDSRESTALSATTAAAPLFVAFNGNVYVQQGVSSQPKGQLAASGQTRMTYDANEPPAPHTVYEGTEADVVHIENAAGELQRFALVKRVYLGTAYQLRSGDIAGYGTWPSIPPGIARPVPEDNPTGAPSFVLDGEDASGTLVYRRAGTDRRSGIAIAPGSTAEDPAAGNPNWTWWTP